MRRRMAFAAACSLAVVVAAPISLSALMGWDASLPGLKAAKSFMAMMEDRSPGDRTAAELTKTKKKAVPKPEQRALGKVAPPAPPTEFMEALAPPPVDLAELPPFAAALTDLGPLLLNAPVPSSGGGIVTNTVPPPGGGNPPNEEPPVENPPAVPEPGTWATMLLGFGLTGWLMRRRRRTAAVLHRA